MYIKGRRLKPYLFFACCILPLSSMVVIYAARHAEDLLLFWSLLIWGAAFTLFEICALPYILRNTAPVQHTHAITLHFAAAPASTLVAGCLIYILKINWIHLHDAWILYILSALSFAAFPFILRLRRDTGSMSLPYGRFNSVQHYQWNLVIKAIAPAMFVAVGAGLTIPYFNLFFYHTFHINSGTFSIIGGITAILVSASALWAPFIKRRFGYGFAITGTQAASVLCLLVICVTPYLHHATVAFYIAAIGFMLRQPLMNMAYPLTSEISMHYVGERNHELLSAIISAIWSGCWWVSAQILKQLLIWDLDYAHVFMITALLYMVGIVLYNMILRSYQRKMQAGA